MIKLVRLFTLPLLALTISSPVLAISPELRTNIQYHAPSYTGSGNAGSSCSGSSVPNSVNLPQPSITAINALKDTYTKVGTTSGVPWQMLAAVDYRESHNGPNASALDGSPIGTPNKDHPGVVPTSKENSVELSANYMIGLAKSVYGVTISTTNTPDEIKEAFVAYNRGSLYKDNGLTPDQSPYVMNLYDGHTIVPWPSNSKGEPLAGHPSDSNLGAFVVYSALTGVTACGGSSGNKIVDIATQELNKGVQELPPGSHSNNSPDINKYKGLDPNGRGDGEPWCASFVSWVYYEAGTPLPGDYKGWLITYVPSLHNHLVASGLFTTRSQNSFAPQAGDIVILFSEGTPDGHTAIISSVTGSTINTIEGNSGDAVRARSYTNYTTNSRITGWGRLK